MNTYKAFWRRQACEVQAETSFAAQKKAAEIFKAKKTFEVTVVLAEKDGQAVIHTPTE